MIVKIDGISVEPLSEAFGQNLETINVNMNKTSHASIPSESTIGAANKNDLGDQKKSDKAGNTVFPAAIKYSENQDDYSSVNAASTRNEDPYNRIRFLNMINKESGLDVLENMETIIARNVEQGKCATFKRVENSYEKRSVNEPKFTQVSRLVRLSNVLSL